MLMKEADLRGLASFFVVPDRQTANSKLPLQYGTT